MNLTQLRYFQTVCKFNSVTQASRFLHISQPSISNAIKDLETEFGVILFARQYRGMALTQEGAKLLELSDSLLEHADQVQQIMNDLGQKRKLLHLGIPPMIGSLILPGIYRGFFRRFPEIQVQIVEAGRQELLRQMRENLLDLVFLPHDTAFTAEYHWFPVIKLETVCCMSRHHHLAGHAALSVQDLNQNPLVLFKTSFFQTESLMNRFAQAQIKPNIILHTDQLSTVRQLVSHNIAMGFLFQQLADSTEGIVSIPLDPPMPVSVSLVWKSGGYMFSDMSRFIHYIQSTPAEELFTFTQ